MSQRYPHGQGQSPYNFPNQHSTAQVSGAPPSGLPQTTLPSSQTLPPLSANTYVTTHDHHSYASRNSSLLITSQSEAAGQPGTFPVYGPTGNIYFNQNYGSDNASPQTFERQQHAQSSRPPSVHMQSQPQIQPTYTATSRSLPEIAPMPPRSNGNAGSPFGNGNSIHQLEDKPHVVGAQGRRGILPSAAGRPNAIVNGNVNGQKASSMPTKDAEGKYPCDYCDKSYLHAKHLKRHLLRREYYVHVMDSLN